MVERQARDLEVRVRIPVQVQIFLLKFMKYNTMQTLVQFITRAHLTLVDDTRKWRSQIIITQTTLVHHLLSEICIVNLVKEAFRQRLIRETTFENVFCS